MEEELNLLLDYRVQEEDNGLLLFITKHFMEGGQKQEETHAGVGTEQVKQDTQKAQQDLKQVADRAKAATAGFAFEKLFQGRIDQMNYLWLMIGSLVIGTVTSIIPPIGMLVGLVLAVVGIGATIRRWHDLGQSGWMTLLCLIPYVGILGIIYLCWKAGMTTPNMYGEAPDPKRDVFKAALNT